MSVASAVLALTGEVVPVESLILGVCNERSAGGLWTRLAIPNCQRTLAVEDV